MGVPVVFALACAIVYGVADYCGGRASRSAASATVSLVGQATSLILGLVVVVVMGTRLPAAHDLAWGATAGVASAVALSAFYHALSHGAMTVVAPITAVTSAALPVAVGLFAGERPRVSAFIGMGLAVLAVALVSGAVGSRREHTAPSTVLLALLAGVGFAVIFVALDRTSSVSGVWPLVASRSVSVLLVGAFVLATTGQQRRSADSPCGVAGTAPPSRMWHLAMLAGLLDMSANGLYLLAAHRGLLSVIVVVVALYPVSTVCLAFGLDQERVSKSQALGMVLAVGALILVSVGGAS